MDNRNVEYSLQILNEEKDFDKYYELEKDFIKAHAIANYDYIIEKNIYDIEDFIQEITIDIWVYSLNNIIEKNKYGNTIKNLVAKTIKKINKK